MHFEARTVAVSMSCFGAGPTRCCLHFENPVPHLQTLVLELANMLTHGFCTPLSIVGMHVPNPKLGQKSTFLASQSFQP